jgi:hypothetical protein
MKEQDNQQSEREKLGRRFLLGGIVGGIIGLLAHVEWLFEAGVGLAAGGAIFGRGSKRQPSQA